MRMLHLVKLMKPLLMALEFFGLQLLLQIMLLLKLPFRYWILVAHGFREWVQCENFAHPHHFASGGICLIPRQVLSCCSVKFCPKGTPSRSPALRGTSYPG